MTAFRYPHAEKNANQVHEQLLAKTIDSKQDLLEPPPRLTRFARRSIILLLGV